MLMLTASATRSSCFRYFERPRLMDSWLQSSLELTFNSSEGFQSAALSCFQHHQALLPLTGLTVQDLLIRCMPSSYLLQSLQPFLLAHYILIQGGCCRKSVQHYTQLPCNYSCRTRPGNLSRLRAVASMSYIRRPKNEHDLSLLADPAALGCLHKPTLVWMGCSSPRCHPLKATQWPSDGCNAVFLF